MKIDDQVCPFLHAKRLKELGVMQKSLHYHTQNTIVTPGTIQGKTDIENREHFAAFTVAELGVALPHSIDGAGLAMENGEDMMYVSYPPIKTTFGKTEAQARANMLIWLIENKYASASEVNERLQQAGF